MKLLVLLISLSFPVYSQIMIQGYSVGSVPITDSLPPSAPTGFQLTPTADDSILATWNANPEDDILRYIVYLYLFSDSSSISTDSVNDGTLQFTFTGLTDSTSYFGNMVAQDDSFNISALSVDDVAMTFGTTDTTSPDNVGAAPIFVTQYNSIDWKWTPDSSASNKTVTIQYKVDGNPTWLNAHSSPYHTKYESLTQDKRYRGTIFNLEDSTAYDIRLTLGYVDYDTTITTLSYPTVGTTVYLNKNYTSVYNITTSGTANAWRKYTVHPDSGETTFWGDTTGITNCITINANYVILDGIVNDTLGITARDCTDDVIQINNSNNILIRGCSIINWGREDEDSIDYAFGGTAGIQFVGSGQNVTIERNHIYNPKYSSNRWGQDRPLLGSTHPSGSLAIYSGNADYDNGIIRYNTLSADSNHWYNDVIGMGTNFSYKNKDWKFYNNYISGCADDAIESDDANLCTGIYRNFIENVPVAISLATVAIGPAYIFENVTYKLQKYEYGQDVNNIQTVDTSSFPVGFYTTGFTTNDVNINGSFIKAGNKLDTCGVYIGGGWTYIYNNSVMQPLSGLFRDGPRLFLTGSTTTTSGFPECPSYYGTDGYVYNTTVRNNIIVQYTGVTSMYNRLASSTTLDYDVYTYKFGTNEVHGTQVTSFSQLSFSDSTITRDADGNITSAKLIFSTSSPGYRDGLTINNIIPETLPDVGAFQQGDAIVEYGWEAYINE